MRGPRCSAGRASGVIFARCFLFSCHRGEPKLGRNRSYIDPNSGGHISRVALDGSGRAKAIFGLPQGYQLFPNMADWLNVSPDGNRLGITVAEGPEK